MDGISLNKQNWVIGVNTKPYFTHKSYLNYRSKTDRCEICGDNGALVHHKDLDRSNNGFSNLMVLCRQCHQQFHAKIQPNIGWDNLNPYCNIGRKQSTEEKKIRSESHVKRHPLDFNYIKKCKSKGMTLTETAKSIGWSYKGLSKAIKKRTGVYWRNL